MSSSQDLGIEQHKLLPQALFSVNIVFCTRTCSVGHTPHTVLHSCQATACLAPHVFGCSSALVLASPNIQFPSHPDQVTKESVPTEKRLQPILRPLLLSMESLLCRGYEKCSVLHALNNMGRTSITVQKPVLYFLASSFAMAWIRPLHLDTVAVVALLLLDASSRCPPV